MLLLTPTDVSYGYLLTSIKMSFLLERPGHKFQISDMQLCVLQVLVEDENNVKALFRRGKARFALGQTDSAREDFQKVKKLSPEDKAVARELQLLDQHDKELYMKQKELYKGLFGPRPEPKPKRFHWLLVFWQWLVSVIRTIFRLKRSKDD